MSATSGIRIWRLISPSLSAASRTGTAQRTMSQPAASRAQIWSSVAWTSRVSVFVIDCTVIGASPPTFSEPSWICFVFRRGVIRALLSEEPERIEPHEVVIQRVDHQEHQQNEAELLHDLPLPERERAAEHRLDHEEEQVSAVQHRHGQEGQHAEVDADDRREERVRARVLSGLPPRLGGDLDLPAGVRCIDMQRELL